MASPNAIFTEIVTTTLRRHPAVINDNVSNHNALWRRMQERENIVREDGGYEIVAPLDYAENSTFQRYDGYEILNIGASDVLSAAKYDWKQAAVHVTANGKELRQNSGGERIVDLAAARLENAQRTAANSMSNDVYSTGAAANQINGLGALITNDGTGTVGGIVSGTFTFWKNQFQEAAAPTSTNIKGFMESLWLNTLRGEDRTDLIVFAKNYYQLYWESLTDLQRYGDVRTAGANMMNLKFNTADVVYDSAASGLADNNGYFLNTNYLKLHVHRDANWTQGERDKSINQDAVVIPIIWQGNLVVSNRARQGKLFT
ncbi:MAG: phage major capsid protein [Methyloceanibacter sp.]|nr:phage major capsid protein [Methyloceanibacter sp.]